MKKIKSRAFALPTAIGALIVGIVAGILVSSHGFIGTPESINVWLSSIFVVAVVLYTLVNLKKLT
ncbi:MAG: hypothetical protein HGB22_03540 [Chlorobiaceae bacterium]|nr:hypothetical protein [Chlorobiaceae bacterium]